MQLNIPQRCGILNSCMNLVQMYHFINALLMICQLKVVRPHTKIHGVSVVGYDIQDIGHAVRKSNPQQAFCLLCCVPSLRRLFWQENIFNPDKIELASLNILLFSMPETYANHTQTGIHTCSELSLKLVGGLHSDNTHIGIMLTLQHCTLHPQLFSQSM